MTDILDQEGITFRSSDMASTHPTTKPADIPVPPVAVSDLTARVQQSGSIPPPPDPQAIAAASAPGNSGSSAAAGAAPPQPQAEPDILDQEGISPGTTAAAEDPFSRGVPVVNSNPHPDAGIVTQYAQQQQQQNYALASKRFTPQQLSEFASNPLTMAQAIQNQNDWPDVPALLQKQRNGEAMDDNQKNRLNEYVDTILSNNLRGTSWGDNRAVAGSQLPVDAQNYINGGNTAQGAIDSQLSTQQPPTFGAKDVVPHPYTPKVGETPLNDFAAVTNKGQQIMASADQKPATTALKLATMDDLPASLKAALYDAYAVHDPNAKLSDLQTLKGYHKAVDAIGEPAAQEILKSVQDGTAASPFDHYVQEAGRDVVQIGTFVNPYTLATRIYDIPLNAVQLGTGAALNNSKVAKAGADAIAGTFLDNPTLSKFFADHPTMPTFGDLYDYIGEKLFPGGAPESKTAQYIDQAITFAGGGAAVKAPTVGIKVLNAAIGAGVGVGGTFSQDRADEWAKEHFPDNEPLQKLISMSAGLMAMLGIGVAGAKASFKIAEGSQKPPASEPAGETEPTAPTEQKATVDDYLKTVTPNKDQTMVNSGIVSVNGSKSTSAAQAETILKDKGIDAGRAGELVDNMTATERDNFVTQNMPRPASEYPRSSPPPEAVAATMDVKKMHDEGVPAPQTVFYDGEITRNQLDNAEGKSPPPIDDSESIFNLYYRAMHHDAAAAEIPYNKAIEKGAKVARLDNTPMLIALNHQIPTMVDYYVNKGTFKFDAEGYPVDSGKSLKSIMDDFDNYFKRREPDLDTRRTDFKDFLTARHYQALLEHAKDIIVTPEQVAKSAADMARLADKYGGDMKLMESLGNEFVAFRKRTRDLLVGTLLTKEQRAIEDKRYPYSIPLKRELGEKEYQDAAMGGDYTSLNPGELTKRLKGSALPVKDIILSTLRETARTIDFVQRNRVGNSIYNLREFTPDLVQVTERPSVKKGTAEFSHSYDPKLRSKLEQVSKFIGSDVKRVETIEGEKGVLGQYDFNSKDIFLKLGTTEGTLTHELGHALDFKLGLKERLLGNEDIKAELQKLAEDRLRSEIELQQTAEGKTSFVENFEKNPKKYVKYVKEDREVLANFFDAWVNSPEQLAKVAPKAKAAFTKIIDENPQLEMLRDIAPSTARSVEKIKKDVFGRGDMPKNSFPFWVGGKEVLLKVSKPMYESLSSMRPSQLHMAEKFFVNAARVGSGAPMLRYGATSTPEFAERNVVKDTLEASVQSGVKYNPLRAPRSLFGVLMQDAGYRDFIKSGGKFGSFMSLDEKGIEHSFEDIINPKSALHKTLAHPIEALEKIPQTSEQITRYGVYRAAIDRGYSPVEAAHYALDATLQFPRGGFISKQINKFVPFFNVGLLATEKLIRAFKQDPMTMTVRGAVFLTAPALVVSGYYLYAADEETKRAWLEIPIDRISAGQIPFNYNKETGEWNYMPTPYALGYMFAGMPMLTMRQMQKEAPGDGRALWQHVMKGFMGSISPINDASAVIPPTIKVALEDYANFDFFRGREIYSKYKEGDATLNQDKTNPYDSETAKLIGKYFDQSPALIDHTVRGITGGLGGYGIKASDFVINSYRGFTGEKVPEKPSSGADGIAGGFTIRSPEGYRSNSYQQFQANFLNASALEAHVKSLGDNAEADKFEAANQNAIDALKELKDAHKEIQKLGKDITEAYNDPVMKSAEKTKQIREFEKQITDIARNANLNYTAATNPVGAGAAQRKGQAQ